MNFSESGIWWIGLALLVLALFPLFLYGFFSLVVLERKSEGLIADLKYLNAFDIPSIAQQFKSADDVKKDMRVRYGYKRFTWPVLLLVFFNVVGFSIVWDILRHHFATDGSALTFQLYTAKFLTAAELPMTAFLGVVVFNYGHMLRRLYVWDVTTQVFWTALYRTWLVLGVASVILASKALAVPAGSTVDSVNPWHIEFFAIGFMVDDVLRWMLERARKRFQVERMKVDELPLSLIQGINFWHEFRLEEEGVENVQNLATCDIIDLAFATRYNLRTLVDWVDQAILVHRMGEKAKTLREAGFISGAIDMAWAAPENSDDDDELAKQIAKTLGVETIYVTTLMNSLYQDAQIHMIWDMWQSKLDARNKEKNE